MASLTQKQKQVFDFLNLYSSKYGIFPTIKEVQEGLNLRSPSTVHEHLNNLRKKGYLAKDSNTARGIYVKKEIRTIIDLPILGYIAAGEPLEAVEEPIGIIPIPSNSIGDPHDYYALKVSGNSMIEEGIFDGDTVVIKKQSVAENGQTVVAIIDGNEATLKQIYKEKGKFRLQPRNQNLLPFYRKEVEIRGVVAQVISKPRIAIPDVSSKKTRRNLRTIDLFAGVGGIRIGFEKAGFETVFSNDFEEQCKHAYNLNFKTSKLVVEDIRKIGIDDLPDFDFLLAGFPCQAFSIAGYRQGFKDEKDRGNLFFEIARIIEKRRPEGFLLENVKNLKSHDGGRTFDVIEKTLRDLGYFLHVKVLNSMEYGNVPQNRERIYIVGFKNEKNYNKFKFPEPAELTAKIQDLLEEEVDKKYYYDGKPLYEKLKGHIKPGGVYQWRRQYIRENKKGVCPTLTANMGMGGHNVPIIKDKKGIRKLTPRECARIQGFPEEYKLPAIADSALYKQFGNSVTVPVIEAIAHQMRKAL